MPPMDTVFPPSCSRTAASLGLVSVVIMAFAAFAPLSKPGASSGAIARIPLQMRSMGSCIPMTPVEATRTLSSGIFKTSPQHSAVCLQ